MFWTEPVANTAQGVESRAWALEVLQCRLGRFNWSPKALRFRPPEPTRFGEAIDSNIGNRKIPSAELSSGGPKRTMVRMYLDYAILPAKAVAVIVPAIVFSDIACSGCIR